MDVYKDSIKFKLHESKEGKDSKLQAVKQKLELSKITFKNINLKIKHLNNTQENKSKHE